MALVYGTQLSRRLREEGLLGDVCTASEEVYRKLRALWESYAQNIGMSITYARNALRALTPELRETPDISDYAEMLEEIVDNEYRRMFFTHPVKNFLEVIYTGGSGSAGGLGLLSYICGFQSEARFLITRKSSDARFRSFIDNVSEFLRMLEPVYDYAVNYAPGLIRDVVSLVSDLNTLVSRQVARDILKDKELFNMREVLIHADNALLAVESFARYYEALSELIYTLI